MEGRPVFVAEHPWRGRAVIAAAVAVGLLLGAWLLAIVFGALGFGSLPGVPFSGDDSHHSADAPKAKPEPVSARTAAAEALHSAGAPSLKAGGDSGQGQSSGSGGSSDPSAGSSPAAAGVTAAGPAQPAGTVPGAAKSNGNGRGPPATSPSGGRGAPVATPSGKIVAADAKGANPNAGGANAGGNGNGKASGTG